MDRLSSPDLRRRDYWFPIVDKLPRNRFISMVAVVMAYEKYIALANEPGHDVPGKGK
ncbi:hypothetical protein D3C86_2137720 [compost metagenome]